MSSILSLFSFALIALCIIIGVSESVQELGINIGSPMLKTDWICAWIWGATLGICLIFSFRDLETRRNILICWSAKLVATLLFMLWYESHYDQLDCYAYFRESLANSPEWDIQYGNGTEFTLMICWMHQQIAPGFFHLLKVSFAFVGFIGIIFWWKSFGLLLGERSPKVLLAIGLFPSLLFWPSTIGKEPIILMSFGLYAYGIACVLKSEGEKIYGYAALTLGIFLAGWIRLWLAPILLTPILMAAFLKSRKNSLVTTEKTAIVTATVVFIFMIGGFVLDKFSIFSVDDIGGRADEIAQSWAYGGSAREISINFSSWTDWISFMPMAVFSFLFRPLPGEIPNAFGLISGIENVFILAMCLFILLKYKNVYEKEVFAGSSILTALIILYSILYSVVSYQNVGTSVRWRSPIVPAIIFLYITAGKRRALSSGRDEKSSGGVVA